MVALAPERRTQLLAFLALRRAWVGRAEIAAMLWPEQEAKLAYSNLRKTLFRLQSTPWAGAMEVQGGAPSRQSRTLHHLLVEIVERVLCFDLGVGRMPSGWVLKSPSTNLMYETPRSTDLGWPIATP